MVNIYHKNEYVAYTGTLGGCDLLFCVLQEGGARDVELTVPLPFLTAGLCVQV